MQLERDTTNVFSAQRGQCTPASSNNNNQPTLGNSRLRIVAHQHQRSFFEKTAGNSECFSKMIEKSNL